MNFKYTLYRVSRFLKPTMNLAQKKLDKDYVITLNILKSNYPYRLYQSFLTIKICNLL